MISIKCSSCKDHHHNHYACSSCGTIFGFHLPRLKDIYPHNPNKLFKYCPHCGKKFSREISRKVGEL